MTNPQTNKPRSRIPLLVGGGVLALVALIALMWILDNDDGLGLLTRSGAALWTYIATASLIFADAIIPVFPGETTLNASATLASQGHLQIGYVILAGALGAVAGDSALYWIARTSGSLVQERLDKLRRNEKVEQALSYTGGNEPIMIVAGRYVPGVRFFINATLGLQKYPYRRFLLWSSLGGLIWSTYTSLLAYWIGSVLNEYPTASVFISGFVTTVAIAVVFLVLRRNHRSGQREDQEGDLAAVSNPPVAGT